jgi:hypothetical protein
MLCCSPSTLKMQAACFSKSSVSAYSTTLRQNPKDSSLNNRRFERLKLCFVSTGMPELSCSLYKSRHSMSNRSSLKITRVLVLSFHLFYFILRDFPTKILHVFGGTAVPPTRYQSVTSAYRFHCPSILHALRPQLKYEI